MRQAKHDAILTAVTNAIASRGVRGLRVQQVADEAGVSVALLYYHFESRLELIRAALHHAYERAPSTSALSEPQPGLSGFENLEAALLAELDHGKALRDFAIVWGEAMASSVFEPQLRGDVREVCGSWSDEVARVIRVGVEDGSIADDVDPEIAAETLTVLVDGLCGRWLADVLTLDRARAVLRAALRAELRPSGKR